MLRIRIFSLSLVFIVLAPVYAQGLEIGKPNQSGQAKETINSIQRLEQFLDSVNGFSAHFEQVLLDADRAELQRSEGTVVIARPQRFRWEYRTPYAQSIISNGKTFWIYDRELDQVTVKPVDTALGKSPAILLGSDRPLTDDFVITDLGEHNGRSWVMLEPKDTESDFNRIRIAFQGKTLVTMELNDSFDQVTRLHFSGMKVNPELSGREFEFETPDGADLLDGF